MIYEHICTNDKTEYKQMISLKLNETMWDKREKILYHTEH